MNMKRCLALIMVMALAILCLPMTQIAAYAAPKYVIHVDLTNQITTVYRNGDETESGVVRQMICSTGASGTPTPTGTFTMPEKRYSSERKEWYYFPEFNCYAKYASRVVNGILFHSVLYSAQKVGPTSSSVNALGSQASHGCIRLRVADAKWIAQNCPAGTKVKIYKSGERDTVLRGFLKQSTFDVEEMSYAEFLSGDVTLASGASGKMVRQLQTRLNELGYDCGAPDGSFGSNTKNAVTAYQKANGLSASGKVTPAVWDHIFAAPIPGKEVWQQGHAYPAVAEIQQALKDLRFYGGAISGEFDEATRLAVEAYQAAFGHEITGKVTLSLKQKLSEHAAGIKAEFGGNGYELTSTEVKGYIVTIKVAKRLHLREKASTSSKSLGLLDNGTAVTVEEDLGKWSRITAGDKTGYVMSTYLKYTETTTIVYDYIADPDASPAPEVTPEPTPEASPEASPEPTPEVTPEVTPEPTPEPTPEITPAPAPEFEATATVNQIKTYLSLREKASSSSKRIAKLYTGDVLGVIEEGAKWCKVQFGSKVGYVSNSYITIQREAAPSTEPTPQPTPSPAPEYIATATVKQIRSYLSLRRTASVSGSTIARLYSGDVLGVLEQGDYWIKVQFGSKVGYVDKRYIIIETPAPEAAEAAPEPSAEAPSPAA